MPAALVSVEFLLVLAFIVALGMSRAWRYSVGWALTQLANALKSVSIPIPFRPAFQPLSWLAAFVDKVNAGVNDVLNSLVSATEAAMTALLSGVAAAVHAFVEATEGLANATAQTLEHLLSVTLPAKLAALRHLIATDIAALRREVVRLDHAALGDIRSVRALVWKEVAALEKKIAAGVHTAEVFGSRAIAHEHQWANDAINTTRRSIDQVGKRLGKVEATLTVAGLAALFLALVNKYIGSWIRCPRVNDIGKATCAADQALIDAAVAGLATLAAGESLIVMAEFMQGVVGEASTLAHRFWEV